MGMKRATYEHRFRKLFGQVIRLVEDEAQGWRSRGIEVHKFSASPDKVVWAIEWEGQPLNAVAVEFCHDSSGYPYIVLYADHDKEGIYYLHRKQGKIELIFRKMRDALIRFVEDTITGEAKRIALKEGFFVVKAGTFALNVYINGCRVQVRYLLRKNAWQVWRPEVSDLNGKEFECGEQNPLRLFPAILKALVLAISL
jgi:hypothetical protein